MSIYCISPLGDGSGYKVHVAGDAGALRVVGIFMNEMDAEAWITADRDRIQPDGAKAALGAPALA